MLPLKIIINLKNGKITSTHIEKTKGHFNWVLEGEKNKNIESLIEKWMAHYLYQPLVENSHFDSARQSQIEALRSDRGSPSLFGKGDEEDRFGKATASQNENFQLVAGIKGQTKEMNLPLDWSQMPPFTKAALLALSSIPFGSTVSYKELAHRLGRFQAARAVGNACARNPFPFLLPCHRIIASDGSLGGFSGGLDIKRLLLDFENRL